MEIIPFLFYQNIKLFFKVFKINLEAILSFFLKIQVFVIQIKKNY